MKKLKDYKWQIHNKQTFGNPQSHTAVKFRPNRDGLEPKWLEPKWLPGGRERDQETERDHETERERETRRQRERPGDRDEMR